MANVYGARILDGCSFREFLTLMGGGRTERTTKRSGKWDRQHRRELNRLVRMPVGRALPLYTRKAEEFHQSMVKSYREMETSRRQKLKTYRAMRKQVLAWKAPKVLAGIKRAMLHELRLNIDYDCRKFGSTPKPMSGPEFLAFEMEQLSGAVKREVAFQRKSQLERNKENARIRAMRRELTKLDRPTKVAAVA